MDQLKIVLHKRRTDDHWLLWYLRGDDAVVAGLQFNSWQNAYNFCCGTWWYMNGPEHDFVKADVIVCVKKLWTGEL
jgi:hypothetical protein